jgi:hypothetical protein
MVIVMDDEQRVCIIAESFETLARLEERERSENRTELYNFPAAASIQFERVGCATSRSPIPSPAAEIFRAGHHPAIDDYWAAVDARISGGIVSERDHLRDRCRKHWRTVSKMSSAKRRAS